MEGGGDIFKVHVLLACFLSGHACAEATSSLAKLQFLTNVFHTFSFSPLHAFSLSLNHDSVIGYLRPLSIFPPLLISSIFNTLNSSSIYDNECHLWSAVRTSFLNYRLLCNPCTGMFDNFSLPLTVSLQSPSSLCSCHFLQPLSIPNLCIPEGLWTCYTIYLDKCFLDTGWLNPTLQVHCINITYSGSLLHHLLESKNIPSPQASLCLWFYSIIFHNLYHYLTHIFIYVLLTASPLLYFLE